MPYDGRAVVVQAGAEGAEEHVKRLLLLLVRERVADVPEAQPSATAQRDKTFEYINCWGASSTRAPLGGNDELCDLAHAPPLRRLLVALALAPSLVVRQ